MHARSYLAGGLRIDHLCITTGAIFAYNVSYGVFVFVKWQDLRYGKLRKSSSEVRNEISTICTVQVNTYWPQTGGTYVHVYHSPHLMYQANVPANPMKNACAAS